MKIKITWKSERFTPVINQRQPHRLTWRMWHPVVVMANTVEEAIAEAVRTKPPYIPTGTELHYGIVGGSPVAHA